MIFCQLGKGNVIELYRSRKPFRASLAFIGILLTSACFYSDVPLLTPSEYVQPIRAGLWENLVPVSGHEWETMSPDEKTEGHCRIISNRRYCGQRVHIEAISDRSYRLAWEGDKTVDRVEVVPIAANDFIVEQISDDGSAEYALATKPSPDEFMIRTPDCEKDRYLRPYAPPDKDTSSKCRITDREKLQRLFTNYLTKSSPADAKIYRRIGD